MLIYRYKTLKLEIISGQLVQDGKSFSCWKKRPEHSFPYFETGKFCQPCRNKLEPVSQINRLSYKLLNF